MASSRDLVLRFLADTSDLRKSAKSVRGAVTAAATEAKKAGGGIGSQIAAGTSAAVGKGVSAAWGVIKTGAKVGGAAVAAVGATAIAKGFSRLTAIEDATAQLKGLGYSAKEAAAIINGPVLKAVQGTAFGLDEAASAAQGALGAGVKNGKQLQQYLTLVGDAATQSGTDFQSMALMMNKVQGQGKLTGDVMQQMAENGLQVMPMLTKALGKTPAEIQKMVSKGQISAKQFQQILQKNIGGAAQKAGNTTTGAFKNMGAALGRVGAKFLSTVFPFFRTVFAGLTKLLDGIGPVAEKAGKQLGKFFAPFVKAFTDFTAKAGKSDMFGNITKQLAPFIKLGKALGVLLGNLAKTFLPAVGKAFAAALPIIGQVAEVLSGVVGFLSDHMGIFKAVAAAIGAITAATAVYNGVIAVQSALLKAQVAFYKTWIILQKAAKVATIAWSAVTKAFAAVQAALNAVMAANPIGLVVIAIGLLVAAFVIAYKKSETFRKIVDGAFAGIKAGAKAFAKFITTVIPNAFKTVVSWVKSNWTKAVFLNPVTAAVYLLIKNRDKIMAVFSKLTGWMRGTFTKAWAVLRTALTAPPQAALKSITAILGKIRKAFTAVKTWVGSTWKKGWSNVSTWMSSAVGKGRDKTGGILKNVRERFTGVKTWVGTTWKKSWANVKTWMSSAVGKGRDSIGTAMKGVRSRFSSTKDWVGGAWRKSWSRAKDWIAHPIQSAKDAIARILGNKGLQAVFRGAVSAFGRIWGGLTRVIGKPLNKVIDFINKGFIRGGINKILGALGVPKKEQIPWLSPVRYEAGGPVIGGAPWQRRGRDKYPAMLDHDEHVLTRYEVRKAGGHGRIMAMRRAIRQGKAFDYAPGLSTGGTVRPVPGGFGSFPSYPGHTGVDFPVGTGTPVHAVMAGLIKTVRALTYSYGHHIIQSLPIGGNYEALYAHLRSFSVGVGQRVGAGDVIGHSDSTGNSTGPHLHFTLQHPGGNYVNPTSFLNSGKAPGGTAGGGTTGAITDLFSTALSFLKGLDPVKWLTNKADSLKNSITGFLGDYPWARGLARVPGLIMSKASDYMTDKLFGGLSVGASGEPSGSGVDRWRSTVVTALKANKLPTSADYVNAWLRQIKSESGGNPKAVQNGYTDVNTISGDLAKGLLQTISATFNAYKFPGHGDIFNGLDNALAAINYAKSRYGSSMLGVIGHGHGYDSGGYLPKGLSLAVNKTGRPEPVLSGQQWDALTADPQRHPIEVHFHGVIDSASAAREIENLLRGRGRVQGGVTLPSRSRKAVRAS